MTGQVLAWNQVGQGFGRDYCAFVHRWHGLGTAREWAGVLVGNGLGAWVYAEFEAGVEVGVMAGHRVGARNYTISTLIWKKSSLIKQSTFI